MPEDGDRFQESGMVAWCSDCNCCQKEVVIKFSGGVCFNNRLIIEDGVC